MEIRLSPEVEATVRRDLASGRYGSVEEYVVQAVELMQERNQWLGETLEQQREKLTASLGEANRGELLDEAEVRRRMSTMKAEWANRQPA